MSNEEKQPAKKQRQKRRGHGEGSVFYRKDRDQWVAQITLEKGGTKQTYHDTQKEALATRNKMLRELEQGTIVTERDQTVKQYIEHWLENVHRKGVRLSTYSVYRAMIDIHIVPAFGHIKLQRLTIQQVEAFYMRKLDDGLSASRVRLIHAVLSQSLSHAVRTNQLARNVCDSVKLPRLTRHEIQPLSVEQAQKLLRGVKGHRLEALLTMAIGTGMREGELLALRWSDISFDQMYLQVCRTVYHIPKLGYVEGEPKTASGRRKIDLSPFLLEALRQHRIRQLEERLKAGAAWEDHDLIFCSKSGRFMDVSNLRRRFHQVLKNAGLPRMRFHDLRHSAATLLLAMGVPAKVVQELLGHSNITMTLNIYGHVLPSMHQDAMEKLSKLLDQQNDQDEENTQKQ